MDIKVVGAREYEELARRLRTAGNSKAVRRELIRSINRAVKPIRAGVKESARTRLPRRGGLAAIVARSKLRVRRRDRGAWVGVQLTATNKTDIKVIDQGRVRHPLYGNRAYWYTQQVSPGWWSEPVAQLRGPAQRELVGAIARIRQQVERG